MGCENGRSSISVRSEAHLLSKHLPLLGVDLVSDQHNRDVLANARNITMPVRDALVRDARGDIEHDDCRLSLDATRQTIEVSYTSAY